MQWRCKQEIEDALWQAARSQLPLSALDPKNLIQAIESRSALYTTERHLLKQRTAPYPPADLAARALFFGVSDAAKIFTPLQELLNQGALPISDNSSVRILDLGAGTGAMGLGLLSFLSDSFKGLSIQLDAIDNDKAALSLYSEAWQNLTHSKTDFGQGNIAVTCQSIVNASLPKAQYDLILIGSVLNELQPAQSTALLAQALLAIKEKGAIIVIEPALRETSRAVHELRDTLIREHQAAIFSPCIRKTAPCPALADTRDWCHEDRPYVLPSRARQMAQSTGLRDGGLKFSYLVVRQQELNLASLSNQSEDEYNLRIVSKVKKTKGLISCFACSEYGRQNVRLLKRNRNGGNRLLQRANRGDIITTQRIHANSEKELNVDKTQGIQLNRELSTTK